jgi:GNAT superfamily N-acetyltransferase
MSPRLSDGTSTPAAPTIRLARPADRDDLARLSTQLGYPMSAEEAEARLKEISPGDPQAPSPGANQSVLVAELDGRVIGWIQVEVSRVFESLRQGEICGLVVDEAVRGAGIGRRLVEEAERWAAGRGCRVLRVRSNVVRERAHAFYRRAGFVEIKTQRVLEKTL